MTGDMIQEARAWRKKPQTPQYPVKQVRICAISDLHAYQDRVQVPKCDLLIVAGDITDRGEYEQTTNFNIWASKLQESGLVGEVVCIAGNHDLTAQRDPKTWRTLLKDVTYVEDEEIERFGLRIYGSPWTPAFFKQHWVFNAERGAEIQEHWDKIPEGLDVLITHGPAYGLCDLTPRGERVGCLNLRDTLLAKKPRVHICGHIHGGYGMGMLGNTLCLNAAICTETYKPTNQPLVIDLGI